MDIFDIKKNGLPDVAEILYAYKCVNKPYFQHATGLHTKYING